MAYQSSWEWVQKCMFSEKKLVLSRGTWGEKYLLKDWQKGRRLKWAAKGPGQQGGAIIRRRWQPSHSQVGSDSPWAELPVTLLRGLVDRGLISRAEGSSYHHRGNGGKGSFLSFLKLFSTPSILPRKAWLSDARCSWSNSFSLPISQRWEFWAFSFYEFYYQCSEGSRRQHTEQTRAHHPALPTRARPDFTSRKLDLLAENRDEDRSEIGH